MLRKHPEERSRRLRRLALGPAKCAANSRQETTKQAQATEVVKERIEDGHGQQGEQQAERLPADDEHAD